jgi:thiamine biosynthesis lipoprotein
MGGETATETRPAWEWRAMGATWRLRHTGKVEIEVVGALADAIAADERRWSRFLPRSEVSRLNRAPGVPLQISTETLDLLLACDHWHEQTEGAFSVMVGGALVGYGYRESQRVRSPRTSVTPRPEPIPGALVVVDAVRRLACVPAGTMLDLGGVARMWSADRAAAIVRTLSDDPAILLEIGDDMVAGGGVDLVAGGTGPGEVGARAVVLRDGHALASSSWSALLWSNDDGVAAHHLIDPATGAPADPASAVVIASDAAEADALSTAMAVRPSLVSRLPTTCAMVHAAQGERHTAAWEAVAV